MFRTRSVAILILSATRAFAQTVPDAHFHHLHLNATDPKADIEFYTTKFDAEKANFKGLVDAVWAQKSWMLFQKAATAPPSEVVSTIWHFGWGAEDMKATYQKQLDSGTRFATPITDISDITGGPPNIGRFFYAYVQGPDGALIELNTANHHNFGHIHLLSADPVATGEWYAKHFGVKARSNPKVHMYRDVQIGPSASFTMDNVNVIIYPMEYAISSHMPGWENRKMLEPTKGRVVDHIGVSVPKLDDAMAKLRKEGVTITDEPKSIAGGRVKFAFIEGPDKMRIEIIEGQASKN
jgi:catechol 2,3-dioxygenase-like lactoylglutathione lyase family enzyme